MTSRAALYEEAARAIANARSILIGAGAGMGVDSGLPDFRGDKGFWKAYPAYQHLGLNFVSLANPRWFTRDPSLAWGFYGHRLHLYRDTVPHQGFQILRALQQGRSSFVFTSNVDGQFQKAGFSPDKIFEIHGSIHHVQCSDPCRHDVWSARELAVTIHDSTFRATGEIPRCPSCNAPLRPNILMFGDGGFLDTRTEEQHRRYKAWDAQVNPKDLVILEMGAGTAIPSIRMESEAYLRAGATLIRINPRESHGPKGTISIPAGALEALQAIDDLL